MRHPPRVQASEWRGYGLHSEITLFLQRAWIPHTDQGSVPHSQSRRSLRTCLDLVPHLGSIFCQTCCRVAPRGAPTLHNLTRRGEKGGLKPLASFRDLQMPFLGLANWILYSQGSPSNPSRVFQLPPGNNLPSTCFTNSPRLISSSM